MHDPARISALIDEADALMERVGTWQDPAFPAPTSAERRAVQREYASWFAAARLLISPDQLPKFDDFRTGGTFVKRIDTFLQDPLKLYPLWSEESQGVGDRYQYSFDTMFRDSLEGQVALLHEASVPDAAIYLVLDDLERIFSGLPNYLLSLKRAGSGSVPAPRIENEGDLQILMDAILQLHYADVRREDFVASWAGANSRVDFSLRDSGVIIEAKMARRTLQDKKVGEELAIDWARYRKHPDAKAIIAVVYDPEGYIRNPAGLKRDLDSQTGFQSRVVVVR